MLVQDTSGGGILHPYGYNRKPVNVFTTPQVNSIPQTLPSASPNSEEELKQVYYYKLYAFLFHTTKSFQFTNFIVFYLTIIIE